LNLTVSLIDAPVSTATGNYSQNQRSPAARAAFFDNETVTISRGVGIRDGDPEIGRGGVGAAVILVEMAGEFLGENACAAPGP